MYTPIQIYEAFRKSLLEKTEDWKALVAEAVTIKSPLVDLIGKQNFIAVYESYYKNMGTHVVNKLVEKGDLVITQITVTREARNEQPVTLEMNQWYTIRKGKIEAVAVYFDATPLKIWTKTITLITNSFLINAPRCQERVFLKHNSSLG